MIISHRVILQTILLAGMSAAMVLRVTAQTPGNPNSAEKALLPGDLTQITIASHNKSDSVTLMERIDSHGNVSLADVGDVSVAYLTEKEAAESIRRFLVKRRVYRSPSVSISATLDSSTTYVASAPKPPGTLAEKIQRLKARIESDEKRITDLASKVETSAEELTPIVTKTYELRRELFELQCEQLRQRADDIQATVERRHRHASLIIDRRVHDLLKSNRQEARGDSIPRPFIETPEPKTNTENHAVAPTAKPRPKQHHGITLRWDCPTIVRTGKQFLATIVITNRTGETIEGVKLTLDVPPQFNLLGAGPTPAGIDNPALKKYNDPTRITFDQISEFTPGERKVIDLKLIRLVAKQPAILHATANHDSLPTPVTASKSFDVLGNAFPNWQPQPSITYPAPRLNKTDELRSSPSSLQLEFMRRKGLNAAPAVQAAVQKSYAAIPADPKQAKDLDILKSSGALPAPGEAVDYRLIVLNIGNKVIKDITVHETLPQDATILGTHPQSDFDRKSEKLTWKIETLKPREQRVFVIRKQVRTPEKNSGKSTAADALLKKDSTTTQNVVDEQ